LTPQHGHTTKGISFQIQLAYMVTMQLMKNSKKLTEKGEFTLENTFLQNFPKLKSQKNLLEKNHSSTCHYAFCEKPKQH